MLLGLHWFHLTREALATAREIGEQLAQLAQHTASPADLLTAHSALGFTAFLLGDYEAAQTHCTQGIALLDPTTQRDQAVRYGYAPGVFCLSTAANTLWCLGFPAQAGQRSQEPWPWPRRWSILVVWRSCTSWPSTCISAAARCWRPRRRPRRC